MNDDVATNQTQELTADEYKKAVADNLETFRDNLLSESEYKPVAPLSLLARAQDYYFTHWPIIEKALTQNNLSAETINAVSLDYYGTLMFGGKITSTIDQIREALKALQPNNVCIHDRCGLYFGLLSNYARVLDIYDKYTNQVKNGTEIQRKVFFAKIPSAPTAKAFEYLKDNKIIQTADIAGASIEDVKRYIDQSAIMAGLYEFTTFYIIAKDALGATANELGSIPQPPCIGAFNAVEFAEYISTQKDGLIYEWFAEAELTTPTQPDNTQQLELFPADNEKDSQIEPESTPSYRLPVRIGLMLGRPINIAPDKNDVNDILPIQMYIDKFLSKNNEYYGITPRVVDRTIEGINMLQRLTNVTPVNHEYIYNTNISQFAILSGYIDANQNEKKQLLGALLLLSNLYVVVWEQKGRTAVRVANVRKIGLDTGDLEIRVSTEVTKGKPILVDKESYEEMRKTAKGEAQNRFRFQIMSKGNKTESALLNEVFGYENMLLEATHGTGDDTKYADEIANVKAYIRKKKPEHKKKLKGWFDIYQNKNIITYEVSASKTNPNEIIYKWERTKQPFQGATDNG